VSCSAAVRALVSRVDRCLAWTGTCEFAAEQLGFRTAGWMGFSLSKQQRMLRFKITCFARSGTCELGSAAVQPCSLQCRALNVVQST
jgi:hypothetical protein